MEITQFYRTFLVDLGPTPVIFPERNYRWMMKVQPLMPRRLFAAQVAQAARKLRQKGARG